METFSTDLSFFMAITEMLPKWPVYGLRLFRFTCIHYFETFLNFVQCAGINYYLTTQLLLWTKIMLQKIMWTKDISLLWILLIIQLFSYYFVIKANLGFFNTKICPMMQLFKTFRQFLVKTKQKLHKTFLTFRNKKSGKPGLDEKQQFNNIIS